jgi:hypothetical protein
MVESGEFNITVFHDIAVLERYEFGQMMHGPLQV